MTDIERSQIKASIENAIEKLQHDIDVLATNTKPVAPDVAIGRLSRVEAMSANAIQESVLNESRARLSRLQHALTKIDSPSFGECHICGDAIDIKRLLWMPDTNTCIQCAREMEK